MVRYAEVQSIRYGGYVWSLGRSNFNPTMMDLQALYQTPSRKKEFTNLLVISPFLASDCQGFGVYYLRMAPKRKLGIEAVGSPSLSGQGGTRATPVKKKRVQGRVTRIQSRAQEVGYFFHNRLPSPVREEIESMEKRLWDSIKEIPAEELRGEVEDWIMDPRTTTGRASAYDRMVMLY